MTIANAISELFYLWLRYKKPLIDRWGGEYSLTVKWATFGEQILANSELVREFTEVEEGEHCLELLGLSGAVWYGGKNKKSLRELLFHNNLSKLRDDWELPTKNLPLPSQGAATIKHGDFTKPAKVSVGKGKRKKMLPYTYPKYVADGVNLYIIHKGHGSLVRSYELESSAKMAAARLNGDDIPYSPIV